MSSSKPWDCAGNPFAGERRPPFPFPPRSSRYLTTSPADDRRGAAMAIVGKWMSGLSIHRPDLALRQPSRKRDVRDGDDLIVAEMIGVGAPAPIEGFGEVGLAAAALRNLGYEVPTLLQRFSIPVVMAGRDLLVASSAKSTGKSAAFCLPVVAGLIQSGPPPPPIGIAKPRAVILAPTLQRAIEINEVAKKCSYNTHLSVVMLTRGPTMFSQVHDLGRGADILVATPGRLVDILERSTISLESTLYFIVDDIDRMLDMGLDPMIRKLLELGMPQNSVRQTMIFTASLEPEIQKVALDLLSDHILITIGPVLPGADQITQKVILVSDGEKKKDLLHLLQKQSGAKEQPLTLIFVETTLEANSLSSWLYNEGFATTVFHDDTTQQERESTLKSFKSGLSPILVASAAESWGLDVQNIAHVINYDFPRIIEGYIHRIRRTRKHGLATSFFTESDRSLANGLAKLMTRTKQAVPEWLVEYAHKLQTRDSDRYYDYLVDKFVNAISADVKAISSFDDIDYKVVHQRQTEEYSHSALLHYNCEGGDEKLKFLVKAITSCGMKDIKGLYVHVNFTAMDTESSKADFFFAELRWDSDQGACVPTCVVKLEENQRVGGLNGTDCSDYKDGMNIRVDLQHCYACGPDLKHPMEGELYEIGHKVMSECYGYDI